MIQDAFNFEGIVESAIAAVLTAYGLTVFTTSQVPDFQKDRPRVQVQFTLGPGHLRWADPNRLPSDLQGQRLESAWSGTLHTLVVTAADESGKADQSSIRSTVRLAYMNLGPQINGTLLTLHKLQLVKESGTSRGIHPNDSNSEVLQMVHDLEISIQQTVWAEYERVTVDPSGPSIRITT